MQRYEKLTTCASVPEIIFDKFQIIFRVLRRGEFLGNKLPVSHRETMCFLPRNSMLHPGDRDHPSRSRDYAVTFACAKSGAVARNSLYDYYIINIIIIILII